MGALPKAQGIGEGDSVVVHKGHGRLFPPARCPDHPLTDVSVWVSSPVPALVSSTYSQYAQFIAVWALVQSDGDR